MPALQWEDSRRREEDSVGDRKRVVLVAAAAALGEVALAEKRLLAAISRDPSFFESVLHLVMLPLRVIHSWL